MKVADRRRYHMLTRVRLFGETHAQLFPPTSPVHAAFDAVNQAITRLDALDQAADAASLAARAVRKTAARKALAGSLLRGAATGRVLTKAHPELDAQVALPLPADDAQLLTVARRFATTAAPYAADFAANGIPLTEIDERATALERALHDRGMRREDRVKARASMEEAFTQAFDAVALLDVNVANCVADPAVTAAWKHDRRIGYPQREQETGAEPTPASETPAAPDAQAPAGASPAAAPAEAA